MSLAILTENNQSLSRKITELQAQNKQLDDQVMSLKNQLDWFKRQLFGKKSEKLVEIENLFQPDMFARLEDTNNSANNPPAAVEHISYTRRKKNRDNAVNETGLRFDDDVPVKVIELSNPEFAGLSDKEVEIIGEKISHRLAQRPASYIVLKYIRKVFKLKKNNSNDNNTQSSKKIYTAQLPANVLDRSLADVSFLAGMLIDKFLYHLPLYRQHQRLKQSGIDISRGTLTTLSSRAINLLSPIVDALWQNILQSKTLAIDETPIKAGRKSKGKMRQAYLWPAYGDNDEIVFHYSSSRAYNHLHDMLGDNFSGTLLTDGYSAYTKYAVQNKQVKHASCWAHTRRYFDKALAVEPQAANEALNIISKLYAIEKHIRETKLHSEEKLKLRTKESEPIVRDFLAWCYKQNHRYDLTPKNPLSAALKYVRERKQGLKVFLSDPDVQIDTNYLERSLRPIPMGRKNWLFCWTELGAKQVGIIQSLLVTCKLHKVNPYIYLVDVLQRISIHPAKDVIELTPRIWKEKFANDPIKSDLDL